MNPQPWLAFVILGGGCFAVILLAGWAQIVKWRNDREDAREKREEAALAKGADNPEIDEGFARRLTPDQDARDKGAV